MNNKRKRKKKGVLGKDKEIIKDILEEVKKAICGLNHVVGNEKK
jgi:hypothetical protein